MSRQKRLSVGWVLWLQWVLAGILGWMTYGAIAGFMYTALEARLGDMAAAIAGLCVLGVTVGVAQWFVLRRCMARTGWWVLASTAGTAIGAYWSARFELLDLYVGPRMELDALLAGAAFGGLLGVLQWLVLLWRVKRGYWWILASVVAHSVSWFTANVVSMALGKPGPMVVHGVVVGGGTAALTGLSLVWLLRHPISNPQGRGHAQVAE